MRLTAVLAACSLSMSFSAAAYDNFRVAIYCRAQEVQKMADPKWLADSWDAVSREVHVDKVYIETHRDRILIDDATLEAVKKFFLTRGVAVAGGAQMARRKWGPAHGELACLRMGRESRPCH